MFSISGYATDIVQRKPGRGETTLSVSCSDKIARWNLLGVQGFFSSLLHVFAIPSKLLATSCHGFCYRQGSVSEVWQTRILNSLCVFLHQGLCFPSSFTLYIFLPSPLDNLCILLTTFLSLITCEDLCMRGYFHFPMIYCLPSVWTRFIYCFVTIVSCNIALATCKMQTLF